MTRNQLAYYAQMETNRSNRAREAETERSNRVAERLRVSELAENKRSNLARERLTNASNLLQSAKISNDYSLGLKQDLRRGQEIEVSKQNVAVGRERNAIQRISAATSQYAAETGRRTLLESQRHNIESEFTANMKAAAEAAESLLRVGLKL